MISDAKTVLHPAVGLAALIHLDVRRRLRGLALVALLHGTSARAPVGRFGSDEVIAVKRLIGRFRRIVGLKQKHQCENCDFHEPAVIAVLSLNCLPETLVMVLTMAMIMMHGAIYFFGGEGCLCRNGTAPAPIRPMRVTKCAPTR